ncbi:hypothetical protein Tsubulata_033527 [Turnera subulata]|uniref:Uncharacterized protein n=1 Tax=Turnera subulata TaxID=218843 RepID=A0A9Q0F7H7_9ROSI|nr:hypothetical protein Tsubulata_033527 [Turnera subulata]
MNLLLLSLLLLFLSLTYNIPGVVTFRGLNVSCPPPVGSSPSPLPPPPPRLDDDVGHRLTAGESQAALLTVGIMVFIGVSLCCICAPQRRTLIIVQVGLSGKGVSLQRQVNEIARTTDTSSPKGWQRILTATASALYLHPNYLISGYSSVRPEYSLAGLEKSFDELLCQEREKFDVESLTNAKNVQTQRAITSRAELGGGYKVVTILVAAKGAYNIPVIRSVDDIKAALRSLDIASSKLLAMQVLWTPQNENDTLSEQALLQSYPHLRHI